MRRLYSSPPIRKAREPMKALLLSGYGKLEIADSRRRRPRPTKCWFASRHAASAAATCTATMARRAGASRRSSWVTKPPARLRRAARGDRDFKVGDRVTFDSTVYCGECAYCRDGDGESVRPPAGAGRVVRRIPPRTAPSPSTSSVPARILYRLPDQCAVRRGRHDRSGRRRGARRCNLAPITRGDDRAGRRRGHDRPAHAAGAARAAGARASSSPISTTTRWRSRSSMGADETLTAPATRLLTQSSRRSPAARASDVAFECVGRDETVAAAIDAFARAAPSC